MYKQNKNKFISEDLLIQFFKNDNDDSEIRIEHLRKLYKIQQNKYIEDFIIVEFNKKSAQQNSADQKMADFLLPSEVPVIDINKKTNMQRKYYLHIDLFLEVLMGSNK